MGANRGRWWWALAILVGVLSVAGAWRWWRIRNFRLAMAAIDASMAAGRRAVAARDLGLLLSASPDPDHVAYLLGVCERSRGRTDAADAAWARVTPGCVVSPRTIEARLSLRVDTGHWATAEQVIAEASDDRRNDGTALHILLVPTYLHQGRVDDALRLIEERLEHLRRMGEGASHTAIVLARLHFDVEQTSIPVETTKATLEHAGHKAPDDDRVWLGRANLAIQTGKLEEADRWLDACERRRSDDKPVWRARLRLALAAGQVVVVKEALRHLPAAASTLAEVHHLRAWLARQSGNQAVEQQELTLALASSPADRLAIERLTEIAKAARQTEQMTQLQHHKADVERTTSRYKLLFDRNQPIRDSSEMGLLAEKLGRPFEARVYLRLAAIQSLHRHQARLDLNRLERQTNDQVNATGTLADLVGIDTGGLHPAQSKAEPRDQ
jgi:enediyne biosynthesis protein E4